MQQKFPSVGANSLCTMLVGRLLGCQGREDDERRLLAAAGEKSEHSVQVVDEDLQDLSPVLAEETEGSRCLRHWVITSEFLGEPVNERMTAHGVNVVKSC
jgi:hypothetical protein